MDFETDILIIGGGVGGCACALAACKEGLKVVMTEETDWIGGQFTTQATPPDEHGWIEKHGCTASYRQFREDVRHFYRDNYPLDANSFIKTKRDSNEAKNSPLLNPGNGWVSPLCAEPKVFLSVLENTLRPFIDAKQLTLLKKHIPISSNTEGYNPETSGRYVHNVSIKNVETFEIITVSAKYFIDATELGDLLPLTNTAFVTGSESQAETGEPSAKAEANPQNVQAFSMCFAMSYHEGEDWTIEKPEKYDYYRNFIPNLTPAWPGRLLSLTGLSPRTLQPVHYTFDPQNEPNKAFAGLWTYRRILHKENFKKGAFDSDITLVNYPQIDFLGGDLISASYSERERLIAEAKQQSLSFLYYLQTEMGFKGLKLRPDVMDTKDGLAKSPYIRESRRIKAEFTIFEQHISAKHRPNCRYAKRFSDSIGVGFYRIDLHPSLGGDNYVDVESLPYQIPLGALIPVNTENILPACKNIGTTHITNGCYRLHPIEWNIGEAVGYLVSYCLKNNLTPRQVRNVPDILRGYQKMLKKQGVEISWKKGLKLEEGDPHIHAM